MDAETQYRDRSVLLVFAGLGLMAVGGLIWLLGLASLLPLVMESTSASGVSMPETEPRAIAAQVLMHAVLGTLVVVLGYGSIRCRRWTPSLSVSLGWIWLIAGVLMLVSLVLMLPSVWTSSNLMISDTGKTVISAIVVLLAAVLLVFVPLAMILIYRSPHVVATCEARDPQPRWTDRCPRSVMPLPMSLALMAALMLCMAAYAMLPVFHVMLSGWEAVAATLAIAGGVAWLARDTARLTPFSWWATLAALSVMTLSLLVSFVVFDMFTMLRAMGVADANKVFSESAAEQLRLATLATVVGLQVIGTVYMLQIRSHFRRPTAAPHGESREAAG